MKCQALFPWKKKLKCCLLQLWLVLYGLTKTPHYTGISPTWRKHTALCLGSYVRSYQLLRTDWRSSGREEMIVVMCFCSFCTFSSVTTLLFVANFWKQIIHKLVTVFSEKTDVPHPEFSIFPLLWPWKLGQGHKNLIIFIVMSQLYIHEKLVRIKLLGPVVQS